MRLPHLLRLGCVALVSVTLTACSSGAQNGAEPCAHHCGVDLNFCEVERGHESDSRATATPCFDIDTGVGNPAAGPANSSNNWILRSAESHDDEDRRGDPDARTSRREWLRVGWTPGPDGPREL